MGSEQKRPWSEENDISDEVFKEELRKFCPPETSEAEKDEMADFFMISHPTFRRWLSGKVLPHPGIRRAVYRAMSRFRCGARR